MFLRSIQRASLNRKNLVSAFKVKKGSFCFEGVLAAKNLKTICSLHTPFVGT
jgi:hypothetical protein